MKILANISGGDMSRVTIIICMFVLVAAACSRTGGAKVDSAPTAVTDATVDKVSPIVELCRGFDYADTAALRSDTVMGKRMAAIVRLMPKSDTLEIDEALTVFLNGIKTDDKAIGLAAQYADRFLGSPASPVRNETLYIRFLHKLLSVDTLPEAVSDRAVDRLRVAMLNRPGTVATDFEFLDRDGLRRTLHGLQGERIMLIFYDPECPHCPEILDHLAANERINASIANGTMTVVAVYAEGKREVWDRTRHELPANWLVGYDLSGILDNDLYDLPAMPIVYLLDADKRVLLKDPDVYSL